MMNVILSEAKDLTNWNPRLLQLIEDQRSDDD
jgi:hypothetical protein